MVLQNFNQGNSSGYRHKDITIDRKRHEIIPPLSDEAVLPAVGAMNDVDNSDDDSRN